MSPASNVLANSLGWLVPLIAYYLSLPLIVSAIGVEKFGLVVFTMTLAGYIGVVNPPVSAGSVRFLSVAYGRGDRQAFLSSALSGALLSAALAIVSGGILLSLAPFLARRFFSSPQLEPEALGVLRLGCWGFVASSLVGAAGAIPASLQRYGVLNLATSVGAALGLFLGAWQASHSGSAMAVIAGQVAGNLVAIALLVPFNFRILAEMGLGWRDVPRGCFRGMRDLFRFSATLWLSQICSTVALQTDKLIVAFLAGPTVLGWYSIPSKAGEQLASAVGRGTVGLYPLTGASSGKGDRDQVIAFYHAFLRVGLILSVTAVIVAKTHGDAILRQWLRLDLPPSAGVILLIAMLTALFRTPGTVAYHVANGLGRAGVTLLAGAIGAAASAIGVYAGALCNGPIGAALGFLASAILTNLVFDGVVRMKLLGEHPADWIDPYLRTLMALIVVALLSEPLTENSSDTLAVGLLKACSAGALSLAVGFCCGVPRKTDIRLLLQRPEPVEPVLGCVTMTKERPSAA